LHNALVYYFCYKSQLYFLIEPPVNLLYVAIFHSDEMTRNKFSPLRHLLSVPQSVIDKVVDQWCTRLCACVKAKGGHHFEHLLYTSADFCRDLAGFLEPLTEEDCRIVHFCG